MCSFAAFSVAQGATLLSAQALEPCCAKTRSRGLRRALAGGTVCQSYTFGPKIQFQNEAKLCFIGSKMLQNGLNKP